MVLGPKKAIQHVPSKGRISIMKIQNFTVQKRQPVVTLIYGSLLVIVGIISMVIDPLTLYTNWVLEIKEGKFIYNMWAKPTYEVYSDVYIFNYTNVEQFLNGQEKLKVQELGPYKFQEIRTNENITIDKERGVMTMNPVIKLQFLPDKSVGQYNDTVVVPNIALIAISTLLADQGLGYLANAAAYYTITALGSQLFKEMSAGEFLWGYDDPLVNVASKLVPGWIDFGKIGIMDRFYAQRKEEVEVELRNASKRYSINTWNGQPGLPEQGFTSLNTSSLCNRLKGTYEGLMISPGYNESNPLPVFRKQACRVHPFAFQEELVGDYGFSFKRFKLEESAFNRTNRYACECKKNCLPDGFVDIGSCYYGFPIALSKPHYLHAAREQQDFFTGMKPDSIKHASHVDMETKIGVPIALNTNIQVNIAVRMAAGNPITRPLRDVVVPLLWLSLRCKGPPSDIASLLRLRFVIAPPLILTAEVLLILIGASLIAHSIYRLWKPKYTLVQTQEDKPKVDRNRERERGREREREKERERRKSLALNMENLSDDELLAKEAVSLLAIKEEEDLDLPDLLINE